MVLTGPPDAQARAELIRLTGLDPERFESLYWVHRHAYDEGKLTGRAFWQQFVQDAGLAAAPTGADDLIDQLNLWDARMWTAQDPAMLAWQLALKERGLLTAILSNMGDNVLENMKREFTWLSRFDVLVWSYQLHIAKPDPAIYQHTLVQLGVTPGEALFLDDRPVNVQAAQALGFHALQFSTIQQLRADLLQTGLASELPLP
jgi:putative hydrolase of the HAD superfamily